MSVYKPKYVTNYHPGDWSRDTVDTHVSILELLHADTEFGNSFGFSVLNVQDSGELYHRLKATEGSGRLEECLDALIELYKKIKAHMAMRDQPPAKINYGLLLWWIEDIVTSFRPYLRPKFEEFN